jgi:hypothetical protein
MQLLTAGLRRAKLSTSLRRHSRLQPKINNLASYSGKIQVVAKTAGRPHHSKLLKPGCIEFRSEKGSVLRFPVTASYSTQAKVTAKLKTTHFLSPFISAPSEN